MKPPVLTQLQIAERLYFAHNGHTLSPFGRDAVSVSLYADFMTLAEFLLIQHGHRDEANAMRDVYALLEGGWNEPAAAMLAAWVHEHYPG